MLQTITVLTWTVTCLEYLTILKCTVCAPKTVCELESFLIFPVGRGGGGRGEGGVGRQRAWGDPEEAEVPVQM